MQLNLATLQKVEVDVESLANAALAAIPAIPSILLPFAQKLLSVGLTFGFDWLNTHFGTPAASVTVSATTNPPSAASTATVAASLS